MAILRGPSFLPLAEIARPEPKRQSGVPVGCRAKPTGGWNGRTLSSWRRHILGGIRRSNHRVVEPRPGAERAAGPGRPPGLHQRHRLLPRRSAERVDAGRRQHAAQHRRQPVDRAQCPQRNLAGRHAHPHGRRHPARHAGGRRHPDPPAGRPGPRRHQDAGDGHQPALSDHDAARHDLAAAAGRLLRRGGLDPGPDPARRARRRGADPEPERPGAGGARRRSGRAVGRRRHAAAAHDPKRAAAAARGVGRPRPPGDL